MSSAHFSPPRWPVGVPEVETMLHKLRNFRMTYSKAGNQLFEAERKDHDDLVLGLVDEDVVGDAGPAL
jgi:hypothetical protein